MDFAAEQTEGNAGYDHGSDPDSFSFASSEDEQGKIDHRFVSDVCAARTVRSVDDRFCDLGIHLNMRQFLPDKEI